MPSSPILVGTTPFRYRVDESWAKFPCAGSAGEAVGVACDSKDRVYVLLRGPQPVQVFERDGTLLTSWGDGVFQRPHGIFIGPDDTVYCTDDFGHAVHAFAANGERLFSLAQRQTVRHRRDQHRLSHDQAIGRAVQLSMRPRA